MGHSRSLTSNPMGKTKTLEFFSHRLSHSQCALLQIQRNTLPIASRHKKKKTYIISTAAITIAIIIIVAVVFVVVWTEKPLLVSYLGRLQGGGEQGDEE